jgi:putative hydrolase of the HAD superfamily
MVNKRSDVYVGQIFMKNTALTHGLKSMPRAIIFDLDDTLLIEEDSARDCLIQTCEKARNRYGVDLSALHDTLRQTCREIWYKSPAREFCVRVGISSWEGLWATYKGDDPNLEILKNWAPRYRQTSWHNTLMAHGIDDPSLAADLADTFIRLRRERHVLYDDALPVLQQLQGMYPLGLLTNGAPDLQRLKIEKSKVASFFDQIIIAGEVGIRKPEPEIFQIMANRLGMEPQKIMMIGNSLENDIQGAWEVGMTPVWLNRNRHIPDCDPASITEIKSLSNILDLLIK